MKSELPEDQPPIVVNGRAYPLWSQFVHRKAEWIGGVLEDMGDSLDRRFFGGKILSAEIVDIVLKPNGNDSAWFEVAGKQFLCGFDVSVGGVTRGEEGWITFSGYGGHTWRIKRAEKKSSAVPEPELPLT